MFSEGKSPVEVAIALDQPGDRVRATASTGSKNVVTQRIVVIVALKLAISS